MGTVRSMAKNDWRGCSECEGNNGEVLAMAGDHVTSYNVRPNGIKQGCKSFGANLWIHTRKPITEAYPDHAARFRQIAFKTGMISPQSCLSSKLMALLILFAHVPYFHSNAEHYLHYIP